MGASIITQRPGGLDISNLNLPPAVTMPGMNSGREAQYARRVKELEDELRALRTENEKHVCLFFHPCHPRLTNGKSESYDCEIPRALGETEGICETEEGSQGGSRGCPDGCARENHGGT